MLKFGISHDVHLAPQAKKKFNEFTPYRVNEKEVLTITLLFIVISNHSVRPFTNPIRVRSDTIAIEQRLSGGTYDTVV